jgi:hypothetical protein
MLTSKHAYRHCMAFFIFIIFLSSTSSLYSQKQLASIPFELTGCRMYIRAAINKSDSLLFMFDTGGGGILLDSATAEKAGIPKQDRFATEAGGVGGAQQAFYIKHQTLSLNPQIQLKDVEFTMLNMTEGNANSKKSIAGIIGFELMDNYVTQIDFTTNRLNLYKDIKDVDLNGFTAVPFTFFKCAKVPIIPITITLANGESFTGNAIFDSGANIALLVFAGFNNQYNLREKIIDTALVKGGALNLATTDVQTVLKSISFNGFGFANIPINININDKEEKSPDDLGLLGFNIIWHFHVVLDYKNKMIYLKIRNDLP